MPRNFAGEPFSLLDYTGIYHFHSGSGFVPSADWAWGFQHQSVHDGPDVLALRLGIGLA